MIEPAPILLPNKMPQDIENPIGIIKVNKPSPRMIVYAETISIDR